MCQNPLSAMWTLIAQTGCLALMRDVKISVLQGIPAAAICNVLWKRLGMVPGLSLAHVQLDLLLSVKAAASKVVLNAC